MPGGDPSRLVRDYFAAYKSGAGSPQALGERLGATLVRGRPVRVIRSFIHPLAP